VQKKYWLGLFSVALMSQPLISEAKPLLFNVKGNNHDVISFKSDAPVEVIAGTTHHVDGVIKLDDSFKLDANHPFQIRFDVDLASLDTGIPLRNDHMRDNFLETGKYPKASFEATSVKFLEKPNLSKAQTLHLEATGNFTLHGVTVQKTIPLLVDYKPGSNKTASVRVRGSFPVKLVDHHIQRPEAIFVKLAETINASVDITGNEQ